MDSSQANNVGAARYINWFFNRVNTPYPQQIKNPLTRSTIDGFPVRLIINGKSMGIYMFNIDRYAYNNMGLSGEKNAVSYEVAVNSVTGAGAFADDSWESIRNEFESRFHYAGDTSVVCETIGAGENAVTVLKAGYHSELQDLVSWVKNSTLEEFRSELKEHFSVTHVIDYYLIVYLFGLVDNLGKNMVLTTFGKNAEGNTIWYPSFYDCDSMLGLTNDGQLRYGPGIDMQFDDFNTSQSNLWVKLKEMFGNEIAERYMYLRSNGIFTYEKIMEFFEDGIINSIGETFYNEDQRIKYVNNENNAWIYMSNGSRLEHMKRWVSERLVYLDSVYEYGDWQKSAIIRSNVPDGYYTINFKTASPQWIQISFSDQAEGIQKFYCDKDKWYSVTGRIQNAVDNNMPIKGIDGVMYMDGIEFLNVSSLLIGSARQLCELNIPNNKRIIQLEVGKNTMLQRLNCKDCSLLGSNPNYKSINLSECIALKYVDLSGTQIGEVVLNEDGGSLEYFNLTGSGITVLNCNKQEYLGSILMDDCADLANVNITNCNSLDNLSITNTKLATLTIQNCNGITSLDVSNNSYVTSLSLRGCEKLKYLNASNLTNKNMTEIDLRDTLALETLDIQGSFNIHNIRLNEDLTTLKNINVRESGIESLQFGYEEKPNYLDLGRFPALNSVSFQNCASLVEIKNMNMDAENGNYIFSGCRKLKSISGNLKIKGDMRQTFANCDRLTTLPEMDLTEVIYIYHAFDNCIKLSWNQARRVYASLGEACETIDNLFSGANIKGGKFEEDIFSNMPNLKTLQYPFRGIVMSGTIPPNIFANNPKLTTMTASLEGAEGEIPAELFANNPDLVTVNWLFGYGTSNTKITSGPAPNFFANNEKITSLYGCFYGLTNAKFELSDQLFANMPMLTTTQEMFYNCLKLEGSIPEDLFANNEELITIRGMFARDAGDINNPIVNNLSGSIPAGLFRNNTKLNSIRNAFGNCTKLKGDIPNSLLDGLENLNDMSGLFAGCTGLTGEIKSDFWKDCRRLRIAENVFQGTNIGKQDGTSNDLPADFFKEKPLLESIAGMFNNCVNFSFQLHPYMFQDCIRLMNVSSLFSGCTYFDGALNEDMFTIINPDAEKVYYKIDTKTQKRIFTEKPLTKAQYNELSGSEQASYIEGFVEKDSPIETVSSMFDNCSRMRGLIPEGLFRNMINLKDISAVFQRCGSLVGEIPKDLLKGCPALTTVRAMFAYCSGLGRNSMDITNENPYFVDESFLANNTNLTDAGWLFAYMSNLEGSIPPNLFVNNTFINSLDYTFYNSTAIKGAIPDSLFLKLYLLENLSYTFNNCRSLTTIGANLISLVRNPRLNNFQSTFNGCSNLTGTAPQLWNLYPAAIKSQCFTGCTKLTNFLSIPTNWK